MSHRLAIRPLLATAVLLAAACAGDSPTGVAPAASALQARGSSGGSGAALAVAGSWSGTTINTSSAGDSTQWSLTLRQNGDRLEGGLVRIVYIGAQSYLGTSAIKRGTVSGPSIGLEFDRGEGAEVAPMFSATVEADGVTMIGFHSRYAEQVTLNRR
jgi:hypothetical protein